MTTPKPTCEAYARICRPEIYHGPSGVRMRHAWDCKAHPGEPIDTKKYVGAGERRTGWRGRRW